MERGVVVVGMHRSGTSAATRLVNLLGVPVASGDDLLPPAFDNPRGHWESRSLVALNDRVLDACGCDWTCPVEFAPGWEREPRVADLAADARAIFRSVVSTPQWVWKDPRNCLLLPFWMRTLELRPAVVYVVRDPLEVAASLMTRDHFDKGYCLALWERYIRVSLESITGLAVKMTTFAALLQDPLSWCGNVATFLEAEGFHTHQAPATKVREFVDPALRHERSAAAQLATDPDISPEQRELTEALRIAVGRHDAFGPPPLPTETATTGGLLDGRRRALAAARGAPAAAAP